MNFKKIIAKHPKIGYLALLVYLVAPSITLGASYNVSPNFDSDCSDGRCNLQAALNAAAMNNGNSITVKLAQGIYLGNFSYFPTGNNIGGIEILGGWDATFSARTVEPCNTVLDGNLSGSVLNLKLQNVDNPTIISGNIKVDGITIRNGFSVVGGGLIAFTAFPGDVDVTNCIIENNHADDAGGGCSVGAYDFLTNNGGDVNFSGNIIRNNAVFHASSIDGSAGGCDIYTTNMTIVSNNVIYGNIVGGDNYESPDGGGLDLNVLAGTLHLSNNYITDNHIHARTDKAASGGGVSIATKPPGNGNLLSWAPGIVILDKNIIIDNTVANNFGNDIANHVKSASAATGSTIAITNSNYADLWTDMSAVSPILTNNTHLSLIAISDRIFRYLEASYPEYLSPANAASSTWAEYYYRFYPGTNAYVATSNGFLYYLGPLSGNTLMSLGTEASWWGAANQAGY